MNSGLSRIELIGFFRCDFNTFLSVCCTIVSARPGSMGFWGGLDSATLYFLHNRVSGYIHQGVESEGWWRLSDYLGSSFSKF